MITNYINKLETRVIARGIVMTIYIGLMVFCLNYFGI